jgi:biotin transport system substrate-specific component
MADPYESVDAVGDRTVVYFALAVVIAALTGVFAQVTVPMGPVPFTLQTLGVYLAALVLGARWGALSMGLYVLVGIAGAPVFAGFSAGLGVVTGPTGGYIVSYPIAAAIGGFLIHRQLDPRRLDALSLPPQLIGMGVALVIVYAIGVPWLVSQTGLSATKGLIEGAAVFVPGDVIKMGAAIALVTGGHVTLARDSSSLRY